MNYLISYNHSGNTLIRYFVELITGHPTTGHNPSSISDRFSDDTLIINKELEPLLIKRHEIDNKEILESDKFIFLLRDKYDCIKDNFETEEIKYELLKTKYEKFNGKKCVINYNDIIQDTIKAVLSILDFIGFNGKINIPIDIEWHKNKCLSVYRNKTGIKKYYAPRF